jgi:hypothetical protein
VTALAQYWPLVARGGSSSRRRKDFGSVVEFLGRSLAQLFKQPPREETIELESQALVLLNTLLAAVEWREWLWPVPSPSTATVTAAATAAAAAGGQQQAGGERGQEQGQGGSLQSVVLRLLGTRHDGGSADLGTLRFDAGLACLAELVPGAVPRELLLRGTSVFGGPLLFRLLSSL